MKKAEIQVIQMPAFVEYDCPYCGVGVKIEYDDFGEIFQIDDVECD